MIAVASGGALPPPVVEALSTTQAAALIGSIVLAMLGVVLAVMKWINAKIDRAIAGLAVDTKAAAVAATATHEQVANTHTVNLRDDLDAFREEMREGFRRMDHQFGEVHDRQIQTERRVEGVETRSVEEHHRIWQAIDHAAPDQRQ